MTTGAAYHLAQTAGWENGLNKRPSQAKKFYLAMAAITVVATGLNFLGVNPMKALVWAGIVQGFFTPPLMLLMMLLTNDRAIRGDRVNGLALNVLGWLTTLAVFAAAIALLVTTLIG